MYLVAQLYRVRQMLNNYSVCCCSQAADCPGGAPHSRGGEGEPGAEAEGRDQHSQAGGPAAEGAPQGHGERAESPKVR